MYHGRRLFSIEYFTYSPNHQSNIFELCTTYLHHELGHRLWMQFLFVRYSSHVWISSLAGDGTQVCRMGGIYSSTKAPMHVVLVKSFLTYNEYYSIFLTAKPYILHFLYLISPRNNNHLWNPLYVASQLVKVEPKSVPLDHQRMQYIF